MTWLLLAVIAFLSFGAVNALFKVGQEGGLNRYYITVSLYTVAAVMSAFWGFLSGNLTAERAIALKSLALGVPIGLASVVGVIVLQQAFTKGPASLISPIVALNGIIVVAVALLIYRESISVAQAAGILLAFLAVLLISRG